MKIYVNSSHRVIAFNDFPANTEGITEIDITEDEVFGSFSDTRKLCYCYEKENGVTAFYPAVDLDTIALLEAKQSEIDSLTAAVDALILESLEIKEGEE